MLSNANVSTFSKNSEPGFLAQYKASVGLLAGLVLSVSVAPFLTAEASANAKLPFPAGTAVVSQSAHGDGYALRAIDLALRAGTPVLAPADSVVVSTCNAGNNHRAMKLRSGSTFFSIIHVTTSDVFVGKTYRQGQQIGTVAADRPNNACARSTGVHLHFGVSSNAPIVDGVNLLNVRYGTTVRSSNIRR
jgi:murein DD-endopeptidase MepM/ murein hydrolase activator NlpD